MAASRARPGNNIFLRRIRYEPAAAHFPGMLPAAADPDEHPLEKSAKEDAVYETVTLEHWPAKDGTRRCCILE